LDDKDDTRGELSDDEFAEKERNCRIHVENKAARQAAKSKAAQPPPEPYVSSSAGLHGRWFGVGIESIADWENLLAAVNDGNGNLLGYIAFLNSRYQRPEHTWTQGISVLIKGYGSFAGNHKKALKEYKNKLLRFKATSPTVDPSS
jgi:hypothetical protein